MELSVGHQSTGTGRQTDSRLEVSTEAGLVPGFRYRRQVDSRVPGRYCEQEEKQVSIQVSIIN